MIKPEDFKIIWCGNTPGNAEQLKIDLMYGYFLKQAVISAVDVCNKFADNVENDSIERSRQLDNAILLQTLLEQSGIPTLITDFNKPGEVLPK